MPCGRCTRPGLMLSSSDSIGSVPSFSRAATARRPCSQVHIAVKIAAAMASGTQPPSRNFSMLAENSVSVDQQEGGEHRDRQRPAPFPAAHRQRQHQDGGHQHGAGHGDAVGRGEVARRLEGQHQRHDAGQQQPVDGRHVDLAELAGRGVLDAHARAQAQQRGLLRHREGAGDGGLRGDHGGGGGERHQRIERPVRREAEERVLERGRRRQQQRALAVVVGEQRRQHEPQPGAADRARGRNGPCRHRAPRRRSPPASPRPGRGR